MRAYILSMGGPGSWTHYPAVASTTWTQMCVDNCCGTVGIIVPTLPCLSRSLSLSLCDVLMLNPKASPWAGDKGCTVDINWYNNPVHISVSLPLFVYQLSTVEAEESLTHNLLYITTVMCWRWYSVLKRESNAVMFSSSVLVHSGDLELVPHWFREENGSFRWSSNRLQNVVWQSSLITTSERTKILWLLHIIKSQLKVIF